MTQHWMLQARSQDPVAAPQEPRSEQVRNPSGAAQQLSNQPVPHGATLHLDRRIGSKDQRVESAFELLGNLPDAEIARRVNVSIRTVASYRSRHGIPGYDGPRRRPEPRDGRRSRLEELHDLLGQVPDRIIADQAAMSLGAVRNYRLKHDIEAVGRMSPREIEASLREWRRRHANPVQHTAPVPQTSQVLPDRAPDLAPDRISDRISDRAGARVPARAPATRTPVAWQVSMEGGGQGIVVAPTIRDAVEAAILAAAGNADRVLRIERIGVVLAT
jgi:hypothetical protein